jgi:hypothetical protein
MRLSVNRLAAAVVVVLASPAAFAQFSPGPNPITGATGAQTLSSGTGTVSAGGVVTTSGGTVAVTMTGTSTLNNLGTIQQTGTGRAIDSNSGVATLTVNNSGIISAVSTDAFRVNTDSAVSLINSGMIQVSAGGQAIDWAAIATKSNQLTNQATGTITTVGEDAVRPGKNGVVNNFGTISATPTVSAGAASGSDGIDVRTLTGIQITNSGTISGRHGIATDGTNAGPSTITVTNNAGGVISAVNGSGLNIDGPNATVTATVTNNFGATFRGGVLAAATTGDGDGIDVDGVLTLTNAGDVLGLGAKGGGNNAEGLAAGGGTIVNNATGRIVGSTLLADAPDGDATAAGNGILIDDSNGGNAVAATTVTNSGLIQGKSGFGIKIVGTFADTITNNAGGTIRGAGVGAAIQTGDGADVVTNRGAVNGDNGNAIDLEAGDDQLKIEGGAATITGNVSGGAGNNTMTIAPGAGNAFSYSGSISNFGAVEVQSGLVTLSGLSTYTGATTVKGGTLALDGANRIAAASALNLAGGTLKLQNAGGPNGQTFAGLALTDNSVLDLGQSSVTFADLGSIDGGKMLTVIGWSDTTSPAYAFRFVGDRSASAEFQALIGATTINGFAAGYTVEGGYTNVIPTPLPAALPLLLSGLGVLGAVARRRRG